MNLKKRAIPCLIFATLFALFWHSINIQNVESSTPLTELNEASVMWIEPSIIHRDVFTHSVGSKFNVTLWANISFPCKGWEFQLLYNKNHLTAIRCQYTNGSKSNLFKDVPTFPVSPSFRSYNSTHDYVGFGEAYTTQMGGPGCDSLAWIEFNITNSPHPGFEFTSSLAISTTQMFRTYFLDEFVTKRIDEALDCVYKYVDFSFPWDTTGDGYVDIDDIIIVAEHFGQHTEHPEWEPKCDIFKDSYIGVDDVVSVAEHFGETS